MESIRIEEEQEKRLKKLWDKYANKLMTVAIVLLSVYLAWQYFQHHQKNKMAKASFEYDLILNAASDEKSEAETINMHAMKLMQQYPLSIYASLGALLKAKHEIESNQLENAVQSLDWVIEHNKNSIVLEIAQLRKARVLFVQKKYKQALQTLENTKGEGFKQEFSILKGDIYKAEGKLEEAGEAYKNALSLLKEGSPKRMIVRMKLSSVS